MNANFEAKIFVKLEINKYNILHNVTDLDDTIRNCFDCIENSKEDGQMCKIFEGEH